MARKEKGIAKDAEERVEAPATEPAPFWVYVLKCADNTLYAGVARDVDRRLAEHNGERRNGARYTASRRPVCVVYRRQYPNRALAQQEEARIKALTRAEKEKLIAERTRDVSSRSMMG